MRNMAARWEQEPGEGDIAYRAFLCYRNLEPTERRLRGVYEDAGISSKSTVEQWSSKYRWLDRARAWDNHQRRIAAEAEARTAITVREVERADYEAALNHNLQLQIAAINALANAELRKLRDRQERGEDVEPMALKRLVSSINEADMLARRSAGLPTSYRHSTAVESVTDEDRDTVFMIGDESGRE